MLRIERITTAEVECRRVLSVSHLVLCVPPTCIRYEPANETDASCDHNAEPEFQMRKLLLCLVQPRHG